MTDKKQTLPEPPVSDPHFEREAAKYEHPIPSREYLLEYLQQWGKPVYRSDLITALGLTDETAQEGLRRRLRAMERDGQIHRNRRGAYGLTKKMGLIRGRVHGHRDGYGFFIPDEEGQPDLFIPAREMRQVFDGDKVLVRAMETDERGRTSCAIVEVLSRHTHQIVGRFDREQGVGFVVPQNPKLQHTIMIPESQHHQAQPGHMVVVRLLSPPTKRFHPTGEITEVLGSELDPGMEIDMAIRQFELPDHFDDAVMTETEALAGLIPIEGRLDLRRKPFVTIDGEDAQDFDDAVYAERKTLGGYRLWVAIADVSHYVKPGTALDRCAATRGNSVYFPGRVIPMLPERLSNDLCSLRPHVDRLVMVAICEISSRGRLTRFRFEPAVIHSHARFTYTQVARYLETAKPVCDDPTHEALLPHLRQLKSLFDALWKSRQQRGAIEFDSRETRIEFDSQRRIARIAPVERNVAHRIIEECMLVANVAAAKHLMKQEIPVLYRIHDIPPPDQIRELREHLARVHVRLGGGDKPEPLDFANALQAVRQLPEPSALELLILRTMAQAAYSPNATVGHFGLAYDAYTHFTSPIRRYPDLIVHRALKGEWPDGRGATQAQTHLEQLGEHCSMTERRADEATRDVIAWLKCEYMQHKVGEVYNGRVAGVTSFGLFVELEAEYIEGLVHISSLGNDYYHFDPASLSLQGERSGTVYRIGMPVVVQVARVDLDQRRIDFILDGENGSTDPAPAKRSAKKKRSRSDGRTSGRGGNTGHGKKKKSGSNKTA